MKVKFKGMTWMLLAAAMSMTACSDSLDDVPENGKNESATGDTGFVKISLNLPSTSGAMGRAAAQGDEGYKNDNFDQGIPAEYKVNNVILALFYGDSETAATCQWAVDLGSLNFSAPAEGNVTTTSNFVVEKVPNTLKRVYALAIVNGKSYFEVNSNNKLLKLPTSGSTPKAEFSGRITDLLGADNVYGVDLTQIAQTTSGLENFMMTNAPISDKVSVASTESNWNPDITTLVPLTIYKDQPSAEAATPNPIYVERLVAKVSVKVKNTSNSLTVTKDTYQGATVTFNKWNLQNTNQKTFLVRNVIGSNASSAAWNSWKTYYNADAVQNCKENRFVGTQPNPYRTYWGIDPNYDKATGAAAQTQTGSAEDFKVITGSVDTNDWPAPANNSSTNVASQYCAENTTSAANMMEDQLTSVLLEATFKPANAQAGTSFFTCNNVSTIYTPEQMIQAFTAVLAQGGQGVPLAQGETIVVKADVASGKKITAASRLNEVFEVKPSSGANKALTEAQYNEIWKTYKNINFYKDGVTYYYASVIKHFGDTYTPYKMADPAQEVTYTEQNHLGRFGVLRNNWYEIQINSVSGPGEPEIPQIPVTPPDQQESYINCSINILSWAKRSQGVDL